MTESFKDKEVVLALEEMGRKSLRLTRFCKQEGIVTLSDLARRSDMELRRAPLIGGYIVSLVKEVLRRHDMELSRWDE